jgi:hypothetical protein
MEVLHIDNFRLLGITVTAMISFVFHMKKVKQGGPIVVHSETCVNELFDP